jgi:RNA polymerase sigma factor (sigma-70 family)
VVALDGMAYPEGAACSRAPSPYRAAYNEEIGVRLGKAIRELTPRSRSVLKLRFQEDLPLVEIARRRGNGAAQTQAASVAQPA